jgi:hypothetical protein
MAATLAAYLSLGALVWSGLESRRVLLALLWIVPAAANCVRLIRADDGAAANGILRDDMFVSTGFIATLLLLISPRTESVVLVVVGGLVLLGSDIVALDSRRDADVDVRGGRGPARQNDRPVVPETSRWS